MSHRLLAEWYYVQGGFHSVAARVLPVREKQAICVGDLTLCASYNDTDNNNNNDYKNWIKNNEQSREKAQRKGSGFPLLFGLGLW